MRVTLQPGGETFDTEAGESVLDAALRSGLNMPHSCRGGSCMSCRARLRSGRVRYPAGLPPALTQPEADEGYALLCMARPETDLVIEARPMETPEDIRIRRLPCRVLLLLLLLLYLLFLLFQQQKTEKKIKIKPPGIFYTS